jgi:hypothetical protein
MKTGLELLRAPFPENQISKLPKPTRQQTELVKANFREGIRCAECGAWHHKDVIHLDYVGHAAATDRLLDADPNWSWEPLSFDNNGLPRFDDLGGMWIKLTVCGVTRLGYGAATEGKKGPDAIKEVIGDAIRNAGMRFGMALDLWHKGVLHADPEGQQDDVDSNIEMYKKLLSAATTVKGVITVWCEIPPEYQEQLREHANNVRESLKKAG